MGGTVSILECLTTLVEGLITFISPCVLPMIPVYVLYFTGGEEEHRQGRTLLRALCFVLGFTLLFVLLGIFAATLGSMLVRYQRIVNGICGLVIIDVYKRQVRIRSTCRCVRFNLGGALSPNHLQRTFDSS